MTPDRKRGTVQLDPPIGAVPLASLDLNEFLGVFRSREDLQSHASGIGRRLSTVMSRSVSVKVSILIVTYNSGNELPQLLDSLFRSPLVPDVEVLLWDNASSDGSQLIVQRYGSELIFRQSPTNIGFAKAVNQLASEARGEFLALVNPDCFMADAEISALVEYLSTSAENLASVGPVVQSEIGNRNAGGGWQPSLRRMFAEVFMLPDLLTAFEDKGIFVRPSFLSGSKAISVDWVAGTALVVKARAFKVLGGFSERWFMYGEDMNLGLKLRSAGFSSVICTWISIRHLGERSGRGSRMVAEMQVKSLLENYGETLVNSRATRFRTEMFRLLLVIYTLQRWIFQRGRRKHYSWALRWLLRLSD